MKKSELSVGLLVTYFPKSLNKMDNGLKLEAGTITSWNDRYVFVDYDRSGRGIATRIEDLKIGDYTLK